MTKSYGQECPIACTLDMIGDRWSMLIIRDLRLGTSRFNDLLEGLPGLSTKTLSERLRSLEEHGLVERREYHERPPRASYHLTEFGMTLQPVFDAFYAWGMEHAIPSAKRAGMARRIERKRTAADRARDSAKRARRSG